MTLKFSKEKIEDVLSKLDLAEKIALLSGQGRCALNGNERLGIPVIHTSDGPHGLRGANFFNPVPGVQLPSATGMGATFDKQLLRKVGETLGDEARAKNKHIILAPTVCLQRSPLIGRGFEAFGEDPILSGTLGGHYIAGIQDRKIAACVKHYAAHDQSYMSIEDDVRITDRTLRELHLLPFHTIMKVCEPWAFMTSYNKINGVHCSEDPYLINQILRKEWGFNGLVLSDWWGTYSTSESLNAGMDLEMPGPTVWRGKALSWAVESRKVPMARVDDAVRKVLHIIAKTHDSCDPKEHGDNNTEKSRALARKVATDSIVLLKNSEAVLPLKPGASKIGLIGDHFKQPATGGGGSSEATPYYVSRPYDAITAQVGSENIESAVGAYSHRFSPLIMSGLHRPDSKEGGLFVEFFANHPEEEPSQKVLWTAKSTSTQFSFADSLPEHIPERHFVRITTVFTAPKTMTYRFGLSAFGKAIMRLGGKQVIDLWTDYPEKTDITPVFNSFSMERFYDADVEESREYHITIILTNEPTGPIIGMAPAGGVRLGGFEVLDEDRSLEDAVALAKKVEYPIIMTGLSSDYEMESMDREDLELPGRVNELIECVAEANANTVVVVQAGLPVTMPWIEKVNTLVFAWYGGQETGNAIADILFGNANPSGKLPITFPKRLEDNPAFLNYGKSDRSIMYGEGVFIGHRYYEKLKTAPLFYFGYGLSYTQFTYSNLVVPEIFAAESSHILKVYLDVKNTGRFEGAETVQIYIFDLKSSVQRPRKELKVFEKVSLTPGQTTTMNLELDKSALAFWCETDNKWKAEAGTFKLIVGRSAAPEDEVLEASFELLETMTWNGL